MLELIGGNRLISQIGLLGDFQNKIYLAMKRSENVCREKAKNIVNTVVYIHNPNPLYPRSGNLMAATDVDNVKGMDGNSVETRIFLNPEKATRGFAYQYRGPEGPVRPRGLFSFYYLRPQGLSGQGGFTFYPSYVRRGIFFKIVMEPRDFVAGWREGLAPDYVHNVATAIRKFQ